MYSPLREQIDADSRYAAAQDVHRPLAADSGQGPMTASRISSAGGGVLRPEELDEILAEIEGPEFERKALAALSQSATPLKRQRMVSKMLLDRWTASDGRSRNVLEVDAVDGSYRYTDTREAAYSSVYADPSLVSEVEQMWSRFESGAAPAPAVRSEGVGPPASDERAILDLLAVHYARNMLVLDLAESLRNSSPTMRFWSDSPAGMLDGVFGRLTAACPEGPEAHWTAQSHCDLTVDGVFTTRFARTQPALLEQSLSRFREAALVWVRVEGEHPLVISDKPVIPFDVTHQQLSQRETSLLGQADGAAMPLGPNCLALAFWTESAISEAIANESVRFDHHALNRMQNRQARRYLYAHPGSDFAHWVEQNCKPAADRKGDLY